MEQVRKEEQCTWRNKMKIVKFPSRPASEVLDRCKDFDTILVVGYKNDELVTDTNIDDGGTLLWMMEHTKIKLLGLDNDD